MRSSRGGCRGPGAERLLLASWAWRVRIEGEATEAIVGSLSSNGNLHQSWLEQQNHAKFNHFRI